MGKVTITITESPQTQGVSVEVDTGAATNEDKHALEMATVAVNAMAAHCNRRGGITEAPASAIATMAKRAPGIN